MHPGPPISVSQLPNRFHQFSHDNMKCAHDYATIFGALPTVAYLASFGNTATGVEQSPSVEVTDIEASLPTDVLQNKHETNSTVAHQVDFGNVVDDVEPSSHIDAMQNRHWRNAMDVEFAALQKNETWHLVPSCPGLNVINCKWVFKLKKKADGTLDRHKARLVAKGFNNIMALIMKTCLVWW